MVQTIPTATNNPPPLMLPPRKAAAALGIAEYAIRVWIRNGFIKTISCGKKQLVNVTLLRNQIESGTGEIWQ